MAALNDYRALARQHAQRAGIDPDLFERLINQESGFNPEARSEAGAYGLGQLMPDTMRDPGYGVTPLQDDSPEENVRFSADYFRAMLDEFDGNVELALAAYNAGPGRVKEAGGQVPNIPETQQYVAAITRGAQASGPALASPEAPQEPSQPVLAEGGGTGMPPLPQRPQSRYDALMKSWEENPLKKYAYHIGNAFLGESASANLANLRQNDLSALQRYQEQLMARAPQPKTKILSDGTVVFARGPDDVQFREGPAGYVSPYERQAEYQRENDLRDHQLMIERYNHQDKLARQASERQSKSEYRKERRKVDAMIHRMNGYQEVVDKAIEAGGVGVIAGSRPFQIADRVLESVFGNESSAVRNKYREAIQQFGLDELLAGMQGFGGSDTVEEMKAIKERIPKPSDPISSFEGFFDVLQRDLEVKLIESAGFDAPEAVEYVDRMLAGSRKMARQLARQYGASTPLDEALEMDKRIPKDNGGGSSMTSRGSRGSMDSYLDNY